MKISVLTILILMLVAGLAMVQMDANTENQMQVLSETEMLTTQGLGVACARDWLDPVPGHDKCKPKDCYVVLPNPFGGPPLIVAKRVSRVYNQCVLPSNVHDCVPKVFRHNDGRQEQIWQPCADITYYYFQCNEDLKYDDDIVEIEQVWAVPGCVDGDLASVGSSS